MRNPPPKSRGPEDEPPPDKPALRIIGGRIHHCGTAIRGIGPKVHVAVSGAAFDNNEQDVVMEQGARADVENSDFYGKSSRSDGSRSFVVPELRYKKRAKRQPKKKKKRK